MNNIQIKLLAYCGFSLIIFSILNKLGIKLDWTILSGVPIVIPQAINWIDVAINKKTKSILEIDEKYQKKDQEQDALLKQAMNMVMKTEMMLDHLTKLQSLYDHVTKCHSDIANLTNAVEQLNYKVAALSKQQNEVK